MKFFLFIILTVSVTFSGYANNVQIANISLEGQVAADHYLFVEFDISWDNSWRTTSVPNNWDAAWLFIKYRVAGGDWKHATLHGSGFTAPTGSTISVSADSVGAFIYRDADGNGNVSWTNSRLRWDYGADGVADDASVEVRVFAVEMIYIPQENYYLGDGAAAWRFHRGDDYSLPFQVTSEAQIDWGTTSTTLNMTTTLLDPQNPVPADYPKGYQATYCMKYEISQEQYVAFLNTLTRLQQNTRTETDISGTSITNVFVMTNLTGPYKRNVIRCDATLPATGQVTFYCDANNNGVPNETDDGQNVVCNFINWPDLAAYLDWAGLRAMTELEFEKVCRGPNSVVANEFAWGSANIATTAYTTSNPNTANELISNIEVNTGNAAILGLATEGYRCGIFAASSTNNTRLETGAAYYGVMELSGNVNEMKVTVGNTAARSYTGVNGNGNLTSDGDADVDFWPGINGNNDPGVANTAYLGVTGVTEAVGTGGRGGSFNNSAAYAQISNRQFTGAAMTTRSYSYGGRGVRTAP